MPKIHKVYVDGGNRVKFTRSAVDGHVTVRTWDVLNNYWSGYTVMGPAEAREFARWIITGEDDE